MHVRQATLCVFSPDLFSVVTVYNVYVLPIQILKWLSLKRRIQMCWVIIPFSKVSLPLGIT
jgi:hypothetical protein